MSPSVWWLGQRPFSSNTWPTSIAFMIATRPGTQQTGLGPGGRLHLRGLVLIAPELGRAR